MAIRLSHIQLFPLKSFDLRDCTESLVLPSGALEHDRRFALFDEAGKVVNGKRTPRVHTIEVAFDDDCSHLSLGERGSDRRSTYELPGEIEQTNCRFSELLGTRAALRENREAGFPDDTLAGGPTVVAAETLHAVADWFDVTFDEVRARFRPNLIIEGGGPFWDDRLIGPPGETVTFRIGEVLFVGTNPCARCVVPTRDAYSGEVTPRFVRRFTTERAATLPDWAPVDAFDHFFRLAVNTRLYAPSDGGIVRVGDGVEILK